MDQVEVQPSGRHLLFSREISELISKLAGPITVALCLVAAWPSGSKATLPGQNGPLLIDTSIPSEGKPGQPLSWRYVFRMSLDGAIEQLTPTDQVSSSPAISPDGKLLAFRRNPGDHLWVAPVGNPGAARQVTHDHDQLPVQFGASGPSFLPSGKSILYSAYQGWAPPPWGWGVGLAKVDGSGDRVLISDTELSGILPQLEISPDGRLVVFSQDPENDGHLTGRFLRLSDKKTWKLKSKLSVSGPSFSPDGRRVTFAANVGGTRQIFVGKRDGSWVRQITTGEPHKSRGLFSPDGQYIAYMQGFPDGPYRVVIQHLASGKERELAVPGSSAGLAQWTRKRVFRIINYNRAKKRLKVRVFNPGRLRVHGPGVRFIQKRLRTAKTYSIRVRLKPRIKMAKARIAFRPDGSITTIRAIIFRR